MKHTIMKLAPQRSSSRTSEESRDSRRPVERLAVLDVTYWSRPLPTLIIDRDPIAASSLADQLGNRGFEVDVVDDYRAAHVALRKKYYRSVVLVIEPADSSGWEYLGRLRSRVPGSWIMVVTRLACADPSDDIQDQVFRLGGDSHLGTPLVIEELALRISAFSLRSRPR